MEKLYISGNDLIYKSFKLGRKIYDSGIKPDGLIAIWRGGTPIGVAVHEILLKLGIDTFHTAIKASSYSDLEKVLQEPIVESIQPLVDNVLTKDMTLLIVDDVFDTGSTLATIKKLLTPYVKEVILATVLYKPANNITDVEPDFYLEKTDKWIVFPHELEGLTDEEIAFKDPRVVELLQK
jgi:hypoxanthine phosphoribosyltransferase